MDMDTLRANFLAVTQDRVSHSGWSAEDVSELGGYVRAAVERQNEEQIDDWMAYLSHEAALLDPSAQACRDAEARVRAQQAQGSSGGSSCAEGASTPRVQRTCGQAKRLWRRRRR